MRNSIDAHSIANTIRMSRTVRKHASALLVEGSKDVRVFRNVINESLCDVVSAEGKRNALSALNLLRRSNQRGVLVVIDSDFNLLGGQQTTDPDVITTDDHDLEAMLLKSPAVEKVLIEHDLDTAAFGSPIGEILARAVVPLGYLRLVSERSRLQLDFKDLAFSTFTQTKPTVGIDDARLLREALSKNPSCHLNAGDLKKLMVAVANSSFDCWHIGCGHDMTAVLALLLSQKAGREVPAYTIERQLRLSYHQSYFAGTKVFAEIRAWERRNTPYLVLA